MKNLKFRIWDKQFNKFLYQLPENHHLDWERFDVQQFTGLTDKLGKDIYDGDVLRGEYEVGPDEWKPFLTKVVDLEPYNFRVDSTGWEKKQDDCFNIDYLENKEGDIFEIASGEFKGEQLFTWDAMMRETKKAGKRVPTDKEWKKLVKSKKDISNLVFAGDRGTDGTFSLLVSGFEGVRVFGALPQGTKKPQKR